MVVKARGSAWLLLGLLAACSGPQSALEPAGFEAAAVAQLFWWMSGAALVIWVAVLALSLHASRRRGTPWSERSASRLILLAGAVVPTLLLAVLLVFGLRLMPELRAPGGEMRVLVEGEQFWWRVRYELPDGTRFDTANEIRLPLGERAEFQLTAEDVIHSFWIPPLGGKMDMIPGHTSRLVLQPDRVGRFRGACAEFCGASHGMMNFEVEVMEPAAFRAWVAASAAPAAAPRAGGAELFLKHGCAACHAVRGLPGAGGRIGPDLTHLGARAFLGAGLLPNTVDNIDRFIRATRDFKPAARMPSYAALPPGESAAIAAWLGSLK
jgi:cytochrome c oxidase subunit 2